ncbi:MAG: helix-turn-helix transcriptional regulator [Clostridia bacterium]|nr:helix-turn-helix transcriptional regulator [Clostridia bacterium]
MQLRILELLKEKQKTKYWLYMQLGLSYQNFNRLVNNETSGIKFENLKALCDIFECTPNDLFKEYAPKKKRKSETTNTPQEEKEKIAND